VHEQYGTAAGRLELERLRANDDAIGAEGATGEAGALEAAGV
jgi:hypothetical protein